MTYGMLTVGFSNTFFQMHVSVAIFESIKVAARSVSALSDLESAFSSRFVQKASEFVRNFVDERNIQDADQVRLLAVVRRPVSNASQRLDCKKMLV